MHPTLADATHLFRHSLAEITSWGEQVYKLWSSLYPVTSSFWGPNTPLRLSTCCILNVRNKKLPSPEPCALMFHLGTLQCNSKILNSARRLERTGMLGFCADCQTRGCFPSQISISCSSKYGIEYYYYYYYCYYYISEFYIFNVCSSSKYCPSARCDSAANVCRDADIFGTKTIAPNHVLLLLLLNY
jgi:hypothetical protein